MTVGRKTGFQAMVAKFNGGTAASATKIGLAGAVVVALSGCMGPTYGTDTPSGQQLIEDVTGVLTIGPQEREAIAYTPRPELVRPASLDVLPPPQAPAQEANAAWPESPEQRLARVRDEATANQDNNLYRSPLTTRAQSGQTFDASTATPAQQRAEFQRRQAEAAGVRGQRRFLSEPPVAYREPAATAPTDELGEEEWRKERRLREASGERQGIRRLIPWL